MAYIAPEILDRVATGDDKYTVTELADGRKQLTPSPDDVSEPGTEINKSLLQPALDTLQEVSKSIIPYDQFWWRRRAVANGYSETRQTAYAAGVGHSHTSNGKVYYYLDAKRYVKYSGEESGSDYYATLTYASSITINQSTGAISLVNPSTYTFTESDNVYDSAVYQKFQGKFVKGFLDYTDRVFYIPGSAYMTNMSWESSGGDKWIEYGYEITSDMGSSLMPLLINTTKITTTGTWGTISADTSDAYPQSGESGGYEWVYCGQISDFAPALYPLGIKTINLTSASWNNGTYTLQLPCTRYILWVVCTRSSSLNYHEYGGILLVDSGKCYGKYRYNDSDEYYYVGSSSVSSTTIYSPSINFTKNGLTLTGEGAIALAYLPL